MWMSPSLISQSQDLEALFLDEIILSYGIKTPNEIAIIFNEQKLSYAELSTQVEIFAQQLLFKGVTKGDFVVVILPPSEVVTIVLLAILRVGAIYTPLDPEQPESKRISIYQDIVPKCTITNNTFEGQVPHWNSNTLNIEKILPLKSKELNSLPKKGLDDPACIFFTSGTTGKSKGVLGSARAMRDSILSPTSELQLSKSDTLNSIARYAWSISMLELLAPLVVGGTSLVLDSKLALDLKWLKEQAEKCTAFHCPPSLLRNLADYIEQNSSAIKYLSSVRLVWYGGDTFSPTHIDKLHKVFPKAIVGTAYGCTEIFGLSHIYFYSRKLKTENVLIGKPIQGMRQIIWNENTHKVSKFNEGEILLNSTRTALEYWKNPELNKRKFLTLDGHRYFRTGDFARQYESGNLKFLERKDSQVKIRGIRIELSEIEYQLSLLDDIKEAAVIAVDKNVEDRELHAFIVPDKKSVKIDIKKLPNSLLEKLPVHMIPAQWHMLDSLPVTENFKVDRKKLSQLEVSHISEATGINHPVADIWAQVIGYHPDNLDDNFFTVGGNSLLVMQLVVELNKKLKTSIEVADIYRNPILRSQINLLKLAHCPTEKTTRALASFATQGQVGLFFRELFDPRRISITCTRYIGLKERYIESKVKMAIETLLDCYPTLKTNIKVSRPNLELIEKDFTADDIEFIRKPGKWSLKGELGIPLTKHSHKFNIKDKPLICAIVSPMVDGSEILQLTCHHIAADDNSMGRLAKEFILIYDALLKKKKHTPPKVVQNYKDYALEQYEKINRSEYQNTAETLAKDLSEMLPFCQANPLFDLASWNKKDATHIQSPFICHTMNLSFTDYVAALSWSLYKVFNRTKFVFCAHVALNRDTEHTPAVGMYVNLLPVITGVNPKHTCQEHAERTAMDFSNAMSRSDLPYELVLPANQQLKPLRKYPFDAFVNELAFAEKFISGYENMIVPTDLATDSDEMNMTIMETANGKIIHLESPSVDKINPLQAKIMSTIQEYITARTS